MRFSRFLQLELRISLTPLLFAFLISLLVSITQGVVIWDEYFLLAALFFGLLHLLAAVLLAILSGVVVYWFCRQRKRRELTLFGMLIPCVLVASFYLGEAIQTPLETRLVAIPMGACYGISLVVLLAVGWLSSRLWRWRGLPGERAESLRSWMVWFTLLAVWAFSIDAGFIKELYDWPLRLAFALAWFVVGLLGLPLARLVASWLAGEPTPDLFRIPGTGMVSIALFLLLAAGYWELLVVHLNPYSTDRYAVHSSEVVDPGGKPHVLLFVIDTFRADFLFTEGEELAPNLISLFPTSVVFDRAYSPSSWTLPATRSIFSSLYSSTVRSKGNSPLELTTLPEILADNGYESLGFTENHIVTGPLFAQGFDRFYALIRYYLCKNFILYRWLPYMPQKIITTAFRCYDLGHGRLAPAILRSLTKHGDRPLFLYVHFNELHYPYYDDDRFLGGIYPGSGRLPWYALLEQLHSGNAELTVEAEAMADMVSRYRQSIRGLDQQLGGLFDSLKSRDLWDQSLVVITSDHGEEFLEHLKWGHGQSVYQELIRVPLILKFPKDADLSPQMITTPVNIIDISPTILDFLGEADPEGEMQGESLIPLIAGESDRGGKFIFSERIEGGGWHNMYTTIEDSMKLILNRYEQGGNDAELYDLLRDPEEKTNLWKESEENLALRSRCEEFLSLLGGEISEKPAQLDSQTLEKLKAMGYMR